ncbi:hypothetical protein GMSM_22400 [Geomonas sp. Red276]
MFDNPEFRKNVWLELSGYRLIGMPLVIGSVLFLAYVSNARKFGAEISQTAGSLYFLITVLWGTKLAAESIMNEIREHTWDGQRMSVLTPWQLVLGKLFGSTIYTWYGSSICLAFYALSVPDTAYSRILETVFSLVFAGVLGHAVCLLASLLSIQKERKFVKSQTTAILLLGIVAVTPFVSLVFGREKPVPWFGNSYGGPEFILLSTAAFAAWSILGVYQLMRRELQMKNNPASWFAFVLFLMIYLGGFLYGTKPGAGFEGINPALLVAFYVALAATYLMAFIERKDPVALRGVEQLVRERKMGAFLQKAPRWLLTAPLVAVMAVVMVAGSSSTATIFRVAAFVFAVLFFMVRDLSVMLFLNLAENNRRAELLSVLYLVMAYAIVPIIVEAVHGDPATILFWPITSQPLFLVVAAPLLEMAAALFLLSGRWRKNVAAYRG